MKIRNIILSFFSLPIAMPVISSTSCSTKYDLPTLNIIGSLDQLHSKDDKIKISLEYKSKEMTFNADSTIKLQGNSTLIYPKKNYNIELFEPDGTYTKPKKIKLSKDWDEYSKYTLKANYNDVLMSHNLVSCKLYGDLIHSSSYTDNLSQLINGGAVDGFPILLQNNKRPLGLYCLNMKKDKYLYNMSSDSPNNCAMLFADGWTNSTSFRELIAPDLSNGWEVEFCSKTWSEDDIVSKFNEFISFVLNSSGDEFKSNISNYVHLNRLLDYALFIDAGLMLDNKDNNIMWTTFDGQKWYPGFYDADCSWGYDFACGYWETNTSTDIERSLLFEKISNNFHDELSTRYWQLRKGILNPTYIINRFSLFNSGISKSCFALDKKIWPNALYRNINDMGHLERYITKRFEYLDDKWR